VYALVDPAGAILAVSLVGGGPLVGCGSVVLAGDEANPVILSLVLEPGTLPAGRAVAMPKTAWTTYESDRYLYRLDLPTTWKQKVQSDYDKYVGPDMRDFSVWGIPDVGTLGAFLKDQRARYLELYKLKPSSVTDMTVADQPAKLLTYKAPSTHFKYRTDSGALIVPSMYLVVFVHDGNGYGVQWFSPQADAKAGLKVLKQFLATFRFSY